MKDRIRKGGAKPFRYPYLGIPLALCFSAMAIVGSSTPQAAMLKENEFVQQFRQQGLAVQRMRFMIDEKNFPAMRGKQIFVTQYFPAKPDPAKTVFIQHGRNGKADAPHMMPVIDAYLEAGYNVFAIDAANSQWNDAAGTGADFTIGEHVNDLARVIEWARMNKTALGWDGRKFALAGHSMGSYAVARIASRDQYRENVSHVVMISPVVSGQTLLEVRKSHPGGLDAVSREVPQALTEWPKNDLSPRIPKLTCPVAIVVGDRDTVTPPATAEDFYKNLPKPAGFTIVEGQHHSMTGNAFAEALKNTIAGLEHGATPRPQAAAPGPNPRI